MFSKIIPDEFYPIISDYAKVIIPSLITYFVTRYSLNRPRKYEIRKKQFENAYLQMYLLTKQLNPEKYNGNLSLYIRKMDKIIYKNYPLIFPRTLKLFHKLKSSISENTFNGYHLSNLILQIDSDYEKLKRDLGYPSNSFLDFFKQLSWFSKLMYLVLIATILFVIYAICSSFLLFLSGDILNAISALFCAAVAIFLIYICTYPSRH